MVIVAKVFTKAVEFDGPPKLSDFKLIVENLDEDLEDEEILVEAVFLSVDPYQRVFPIPVGSTMIGLQVAKVIRSKNEKFPESAHVVGPFGWRSHTKIKPKADEPILSRTYLLPSDQYKALPWSYALSVLGMPGATAYFGLNEILDAQKGETLVVTTAAGAVGSIAGQMAKTKGIKVIGITGTDEKCEWLKNELGFAHAINYKTANVEEELKAAAPDGVDCYFDNVGGKISASVMNQMNKGGRIAVCGAITSYNLKPEEWAHVPPVQPIVLFKQLRMEGFEITRWSDRYMDALATIYDMIGEVVIKIRETVTDGFENMPKAFIEMLNGTNVGKAIVKVQCEGINKI